MNIFIFKKIWSKISQKVPEMWNNKEEYKCVGYVFSYFFNLKKKSQTNETKSKLLSKQKNKAKMKLKVQVTLFRFQMKNKAKTVKMVLDLRPRKAFVVVIFSFYQKSECHL